MAAVFGRSYAITCAKGDSIFIGKGGKLKSAVNSGGADFFAILRSFHVMR